MKQECGPDAWASPQTDGWRGHSVPRSPCLTAVGPKFCGLQRLLSLPMVSLIEPVLLEATIRDHESVRRCRAPSQGEPAATKCWGVGSGCADGPREEDAAFPHCPWEA